jgi:two-component system, OmpR family, sensor kinase
VHRRQGRLYRRFYGFTLLVVLASVGVAFLIGNIGHAQQFREHFLHVGTGVAQLAAEQLAPALADPQKLQASLNAIAGRLDARLAVFGPDRQPLARSGEAIPTPPASEFDEATQNGSSVGHEMGLGHWVLFPILHDGALRGYLQGALVRRLEPPSLWRAASSFALVLILVALFMVPATRGVTRPLEQLTVSIRRFGAGDFSHRVPVHGHDEIAKLAVAMNEMAERLSTLLHTQRELLANVSHELRSPLARIEVALELARGQANPEGPLAEIADDVGELSRLIDDVLATSRLELRPESARPSRLSIPDLLDQASRRAVAAGLASSRLKLDLQPDLPDAMADGELCAHALQNLLDNARKHTPEATQVTLGAAREGDRIRLFVRDAGPGLPAEELPRLFEPFYRPDASRTRAAGGGAGLGLSLVRRIAELHGGEPEVKSAPGQGTTFSFTVPAAGDPGPASPDGSPV